MFQSFMSASQAQLMLLYCLFHPLQRSHNWTWCSLVMTHLSWPPLKGGFNLLLFSSWPLQSGVVIYVSVPTCVAAHEETDRDRASRRTGRLAVCSSAARLSKRCRSCGHTVHLQVLNAGRRECCLRVCAAWACGGSHMFLAVLSKPVCSPGGCHGNSQTLADFATSLLGGLMRTETRFRRENWLLFLK